MRLHTMHVSFNIRIPVITRIFITQTCHALFTYDHRLAMDTHALFAKNLTRWVSDGQ